MLKHLTILIFSLSILFSMMPVVHAEYVRLPVACVCVDKKYTVYGEDQPQKTSGACFVEVDLQPPATADDTVNAGKEGALSFSDKTGLTSLLSPLRVLYEQSKMKSAFSTLLRTLFAGHTEKYHAFLDKEVFGKAIALVSSFETTMAFDDYMKDQNGTCTENGKKSNPKPDCVIERALCSYEKYVGVLFHESGQPLTEQALEMENIDQLLGSLQNRDQFLIQEAQQAEQALDVAISVYSQFYQTYRLHLRFKELIVHLARVRDMTKYLRNLVTCIPNKFVGVATTKCN